MNLDKRHIPTDDFIKFLKENDFIEYSYQEYGGTSGLIDYDANGVRIFENVQRIFQNTFKKLRFHKIKGTILTKKEYLQKSGHLDNFSDQYYSCEECGFFFIDRMEKCLKCSRTDIVVKSRDLMFKVENRNLYLRPETTGTFFNFLRKYIILKSQIPVGFYQSGTSFRNEVSPRQGLNRLKEFNQLEAYFCFKNSDSGKRLLNSIDFDDIKQDLNINFTYGETFQDIQSMTADEFLNLDTGSNFYFKGITILMVYKLIKAGFDPSRLVISQCLEPAHYSLKTYDIYVLDFDGTPVELMGIAMRTPNEVTNHVQDFPKDLLESLNFLEISIGLDRCTYMLMKTNVLIGDRNNFKLDLPTTTAPYPLAFLPLVDHEELVQYTKRIQKAYNNRIPSLYLEKRSLGKRYLKCDAIGIPYVITVDYESLESNTVTIRKLTTKKQERININEIIRYYL